jgi:hypothetical protein
MNRVVVDPYVAMGILDHHMRRPDVAEQEAGKAPVLDRVSGVIMGSHVKNELYVRNFSQTFDHQTMSLLQRSAPGELGVGWYTTQFHTDDIEGVHKNVINAGMKRPTILVAYLPTEKQTEVTFRAFQTVTVAVGESDKSVTALKEIPCVIEAVDNATNVAIDTVVAQIYPETARASDPARLPASSPAADPFAELVTIRKNLVVAREYVNDATKGKRKVSKATLRAISELLVTNRVAAASSSAVQEKMQDVLMLQYLATALEQQVSKLMANAPLQQHAK